MLVQAWPPGLNYTGFFSVWILKVDVRIMPLIQDVHILIPGTCEYVPYTTKGFTRLRAWRWGGCLGLSEPNVIIRVFIKKIRGQENERKRSNDRSKSWESKGEM